MNLVLQVQIPNDNTPYPKKLIYDEFLYKCSKTSCEEYSNNIAADYIYIRDKKYLPNKHASYQRFAMLEMNNYENILYVDSDAIVMKNCPNIFNLPFTDLAAVPDFDDNNPDHVKRKIQKRKSLGIETPFCSGVLLTSKEWRIENKDKILTLTKGFNIRDQDILNITQGKGEYTQLDENWGCWYKNGLYINHFGAGRKTEFVKYYNEQG